jgi:hypothetical protein
MMLYLSGLLLAKRVRIDYAKRDIPGLEWAFTMADVRRLRYVEDVQSLHPFHWV